MAAAPIKLSELFKLGDLGIAPSSISFSTVTMESDKFICVREAEQGSLAVVETASRGLQRMKNAAEAALMNPATKILAMRAGSNIQIFNLDLKAKLKACTLPEAAPSPCVFWKWISPSTLALVTPTSVLHWSMDASAPEPKKVFDRVPQMAEAQVISYRTDSSEKWCLLTGLARQPDGTTRGVMQLYSVDRNQSQSIEGHAGVMLDYTFPGTSVKTSLICFASASPAGGKLMIMEIPGVKPAGAPAFNRVAVPVTFNAGDFPVAMQASEKHGIVYLVSRGGLLYMFEVESGQMVASAKVSKETDGPIFVTAANEATHGFIGINKAGQVLSVSVDEAAIIPYVQSIGMPDVAIKISSRANLAGGDALFMEQFNKLLAAGNYTEAIRLAAESPNGILRTPATIQRLQACPPQPGQPAPISAYFKTLLERGKLNPFESLELSRIVLQKPGGAQYIKSQIEQDKMEGSEDLGDLLRGYDADLSLAIYIKSNAPNKVISSLLERGDFAKVMAYCKRTGFAPDYLQLIINLLHVNPDSAMSFAVMLYTAEGGPLVDPTTMTETFVQRNMIKQASGFLLEILKNNRPDEAALQTRLLEINLLYSHPQIADEIMGNDLFTHYDRLKIAQLCEKAQLYQRALENYTELADIKRVIVHTHAINAQWLVNFIGTLPAEEGLECLKVLLAANPRANLQIVIQAASKCSETIAPTKLIALFEQYKSYEGLFYYLGTIVNFSQEAEVHFKYIEAATKVGQYGEVERVTRESNFYDAAKVKDFLKESRLPDQWPLINVCDRFDFVEELVHFLYSNNLLKFVDLFVQKRNPMRTPIVIGSLLDVDCSEDYIKNLLTSVGPLCPIEPLVEQVEKRNRLKLILPWLEARANENNQEVVLHNALAKIYIDVNNSPESFLKSNTFYDSRIVGKYCEKRDPQLAFIAYKRGQCDLELVALTSKNGMFKQQARYLVERQNKDLWTHVLGPENQYRRQLIDQVVQTALPDTKSPEEVSETVKAFMAAGLPNELIELLEKIVLQGSSEFKKNKYLQNLLILTAIKADKSRVMDYINRLDDYDAPDIATIAVDSELFEEAFVMYRKFKYNKEAIRVLLDNLHSIERATEFCERINDPEVWSLLAGAQLNADMVPDAIDSFLKANDPVSFQQVIAAAERGGYYSELVKYLQMARKKAKESTIDTELVYALAKTNRLVDMEEFITSPNSAQLQTVGERCFEEGSYEAAKILFSSMNNYPRLASTLIRLGQFHAAVEAARKANSIRTWKEVNAACVEAREFRLAQMCGLQIIVHADELEEMIQNYESRGYFEELIALMEAGLGHERAHMGMFTELGVLYAKYRPEKLMEHISLFWKRTNIPKLLRACENNQLWAEMRFLYIHYDEFDNAAKLMMEHPIEAWDHTVFVNTIVKVVNMELYYKAVAFYLEEHPKQLNDLLSALIPRIDHPRVILDMRRLGHLALIKPYLQAVQPNNVTAVNEALNELFIEEEDFDELRHSIDTFDSFDKIALAQKLERSELLEFRRISSYLYKKNKRFSQSIELSKKDKLYKDAMETVSDSADSELASDLLNFFVDQGLHECFAACLFTCYDLIRPDVALELSWRHKIQDFAMPYLIQVVKEYTTKVDDLQSKVDNLTKAASPEEVAAAQAEAGLSGGPIVMQMTGAGMVPVQLTGMGAIPLQHTGMVGAIPMMHTGYAGNMGGMPYGAPY